MRLADKPPVSSELPLTLSFPNHLLRATQRAQQVPHGTSLRVMAPSIIRDHGLSTSLSKFDDHKSTAEIAGNGRWH